jgi:hypothetical protein
MTKLRASTAIRSILPILTTMIPSISMVVYGVMNNHWFLEDDTLSIQMGHVSPLRYFLPDGTGRFIPFYWLSHWLTFKLLAVTPWALTLCHGVYLMISVMFAYLITMEFGGKLAGIIAGWMVALNLATAENLYTLSKNENGQLPFFLAATWMICRRAGRRAPSSPWLEAGLYMAVILCGAMFKETGILLGATSGLWLLSLIASGRLRSDWREVLMPMAGCVGAGVDAVVVLARNWSGATYFNSAVAATGGTFISRIHLLEMLSREWHSSFIILAGLPAGAWLAWRLTGPGRLAIGLVTAQLAILIAFFSLLTFTFVYYLQVPVALGAILIAGACGRTAKNAGAWIKGPLIATLCLLTAWGAQRAVIGASVLTGFGWIEERLTADVIRERPERVVFYWSGTRATHFFAKYNWVDLNQVPVRIVLAGFTAEYTPEFTHIPLRDLRQGDWIVEQFGPPQNGASPLRGVRLVRNPELGLVTREEKSILPLRTIIKDRIEFPAIGNPLFSHPAQSYIESRVYQVTRAPDVTFEGLTADLWMGANATMWIRGSFHGAVILHLSPFAPPSRPAFKLHFTAGGREIASCGNPAESALVCRVQTDWGSLPAEADGWIKVELSADAKSPLELGLSPDPRPFSYHFGPTIAAGAEALTEPPT